MERMLSNAGTRIWSISTGDGVPVLLCNGGPGCDDYLGPVAAMIEDRCQVIRFEPRGCGRSDRDKRYDLATTVADIDFVRQAYGHERVIIAGHSAGVDFALAYAMQHPQHVSGLIGLSGGRVVNDREWSRIYKENLATRGEDLGGKVFDSDPDVNRIGVASWREYIARPSLLRDLSRIEVPAVFINAAEDVRPNWPTKQLAMLIPNAQYVEIEGAAHSMWLSRPAELQQALRQAVATIAG